LSNENPDMQQITNSFNFLVYDSEAEMTDEYQELLKNARAACNSSYAPYSHYHVGAAVQMADGSVITVSNQENMSFPAGICAERVALFTAVTKFPEICVKSIAISAKSDSFPVNEPVPPCGICRQAILEYELKFKNKIQMILGGENGKIFVINGIQNLLPLAFVEKNLMKKK